MICPVCKAKLNKVGNHVLALYICNKELNSDIYKINHKYFIKTHYEAQYIGPKLVNEIIRLFFDTKNNKLIRYTIEYSTNITTIFKQEIIDLEDKIPLYIRDIIYKYDGEPSSFINFSTITEEKLLNKIEILNTFQ